MIVRAKRNTNFTILSNTGLNDERLSFKAKGLLAFLLSKPDGWTVSYRALAHTGPDGETAVRTGLQELESAGYLVRTQKRNEDGTFSGESTIFDEPCVENRSLDNRSLDNHRKVSTDRTSTDVVSTEDIKPSAGAALTEPPESELSDGVTELSAPGEQSKSLSKEVLAAYVEATGYAKDEVAWAREAKAAQLVAKAGHTPEEVVACYKDMKRQPFWATKHLSLMSVRTQLPAYLKAHPVRPKEEEISDEQFAELRQQFAEEELGF